MLELVAVLAAKAAPAVVPLAAEFVRRRVVRANAAPSALAEATTQLEQLADRVVGPAYGYLRSWSPELRALLVQVADELELNPAALATVIELESRGDPSVPKGDPAKVKLGLPRAGLIQITTGARLPGFDSDDAVWAVRSWSVERQLREVVKPFFARYKKRTPSWSAWDLYQRNFLPALVGIPESTVIAVKDDGRPANEWPPAGPKPTDPIAPGQRITKGALYASNPVFDPGKKKGFYTWGDVKAKVTAVERTAGGKVITVSGKVLDATEAAAVAAPTQATKPAAVAPPEAPNPAAAAALPVKAPRELPAQVAPALRTLRKQVDAAWPSRSRASDGALADEAHNARCRAADPLAGLCDHSMGRALDFTLDAAKGPNLDTLAEVLLRDPRTRYVIWNRRIANPKIDGGAWRPYTGSNPHTRHLHLSVLEERRNDDRAWSLPAAAGGGVAASPATTSASPNLPNLPEAWIGGLVDNVYWLPVRVGPYEVRVAGDALSVAGMRLPCSFAEELELARRSLYLPPTKAVCDARWGAATRRVILDPLGPADDAKTIQRFGRLPGQVAEWNKRIGPKGGPRDLVDGPWKEWILTDSLVEDERRPGSAVNYGFRRSAGGDVWQTPGRRHDARYKEDATQLWAPMARKALREGVEVDLVDELARGAPDLMEGRLPGWLKERLR